MTRIVYPYKQVHGKYYPILDIEAIYAKQRPVECYIDSGASISAFHSYIAEVIGLDYKKGRLVNIGGSAGKIKGYLNKIQLIVGGHKIKCEAIFSDHLKSKTNLIGLKDFFEKFKITFDTKRKKVLLDRYWP